VSNLVARLALGTVQFGLDYGINNPAGRVQPDEGRRILGLAQHAGIDLLDTAAAYGAAQSVIGNLLAGERGTFKLVSKISPTARTPEDILESARQVISELRVDTLYGLLIHDFAGFTSRQDNWDAFRQLRLDGRVQKIGFSVYSPIEVDWLIQQNIDFDMIQLPYSVFDQRFDAHIPQLRARGVEVHIRSAFLQGLFFVPEHELQPHFRTVAPKLKALRALAAAEGLPLASMLLGFALGNPGITKVVIGVDNAQGLEENVASLAYFDRVDSLRPQLEQFREDDEDILVPSKWA